MSGVTKLKGRGPIHDSKTGSPSKKKLAKNKNDPPEEENSKQFKTTDESFEEENSELETENESSEEENRVVLECSKPKDVPDYPKNSTMINRSRSDSKLSEIQRIGHQDVSKEKKQNEENQKSPKRSSLLITLCVVCIGICSLYIQNNKTDDHVKVGTSFTIKEISQMYPIHNEIVWGYLKTGIERLVNQEKEPATFFLVQRSGKNDIAYDIAYAAGNIVAKSLSPSHSSYNPVILAPSILNSYERGDIIHLYEEDLKNQHVLIVKDVEKVVPEIVQDFRYYCDEENPIVSKLAIFFIMNVDQCENITEADISGGSIKEIVVAVETCLTKIWGGEAGLEDAVLYPVLSRVVNVVLPIQGI